MKGSSPSSLLFGNCNDGKSGRRAYCSESLNFYIYLIPLIWMGNKIHTNQTVVSDEEPGGKTERVPWDAFDDEKISRTECLLLFM